MVFSSVLFLTMFLPIVLGLYFLSEERFRNYILLTASLVFYAWGEPKAIFVMLSLIILTYFTTIAMERFPSHAKILLSFSILLNLSALLFYKYWMFLLQNLNYLSNFLHFKPVEVPSIALPIGISFYVFQIISYLIDTYRRGGGAQKNIVSLAMYLSLFPQLVAGPIVRYETIAQEINNRKTDFDNIYWGLRRFVIGLAKKVLIADQIAVVSDSIFNTPVNDIPCLFAWVGAFAYTLQLYYDFSAYSDMAIGIGRVFNFKFLENFNYPFISTSISEFWRRWHISLGSWFRDYLFLPLSRALSESRCFTKISETNIKKANVLLILISLLVVWGATGLWHGAAWTFVVWGLYNGFFILFEVLTNWSRPKKSSGLRIIQHIYTILVFVVGFVIFRSESMSYAVHFLKIMFVGNAVSFNNFYKATSFLTYSNILVFITGFIFATPVVANWYKKYAGSKIDSFVMLSLFAVAYVFAVTSTFSPFIYFRF